MTTMLPISPSLPQHRFLSCSRLFTHLLGCVVSVSPFAVAEARVPPATVSLNPFPRCVTAPVFYVRVDLSGADSAVVGGQFFLEYDPTMLSFVGITAGNAPFSLLIYSHVDQALGEVELAVGVPGGGPGTLSDTTMAVIQFAPLQQGCNLTALLDFRAHTPPTRLTNSSGGAIIPVMVPTPRMIIDGAPLFPCRVDLDVNGAIEPVDIALFVTLWMSSLSSSTLDADFDGNGFVEPADIAQFVGAWLAAIGGGC